MSSQPDLPDWPSSRTERESDRVSTTPTTYVGLLAGVTVATAAAVLAFGWVARLIADHWDRHPLVVRVLAERSTTELGWTAAVVGVLVALVVVTAVRREGLTATFRPTGVLLEQEGDALLVAREQLTDLWRDGAWLVCASGDGRQLARRKADTLGWSRLARHAKQWGYQWHDQDPYRENYRRWVDGMDEVSDEAHELLRQRQEAVRKKKTDEAEVLAGRLQRRDWVVVDRGGRQLVRPVVSSSQQA